MAVFKQYINGKAVAAKSGKTLSVEDPSTRAKIATVPHSGKEDINAAVAAARAAFPSWSSTTPGERSLALLKLADALESQKRKFVVAESQNAGKPISAVGVEVDAVVDNLRYFAGAARNMEGKAVAEYLPGRTSMIRRDPVGVIASIAPWNYPLLMAGWKIGPALATGNTIVLKPSARTPISALMLGKLAQEILPPGVLNVITGPGSEVGAALSRHPGIDMVSVTGDTATGKRIAAAGAESVKRLHLELGGKAPVLIFDDANLELAAETMRAASFWNAGQDCTAACRIVVGPKSYEKFVALLEQQVKTIKVGATTDKATEMGSLISAEQLTRVEGFVSRASKKAEIVLGGKTIRSKGHYYAPTIIAGPAQSSEIVQDEVFGPVVTVQRAKSEEQMVEWANDCRFGLASSIWTNDVARAFKVSKALQFGTVWVNDHFTLASEMPHGGFKQSGYGKDQSMYALEDYTVAKHIMVRSE
ncbi:MAG: aldehyde dehydrogenase family protein [Candidatus Limnocylindrus sp. ZSMar2m-chloro-G89]|nr:MAG: aldehyde dehydrogenase family protein [Candidatus Limnocylindrus sp.]RLT49225.1 MAG: aldehyde dehydrogenase family protein [Candidatus Limnocylindrus sp. ZSMar2m-chloro-G89]